MKLSTNPISSPGRAEKYPPPLMRFLRTNIESKSRGRPRTSPMFIRKKNTAIETQEPSSPKVTCMGQVRVSRSKQTTTRPGKPKPSRRRCNWLQNCLHCHRFNTKLKPAISFLPSCTKFVSCFCFGWCCSKNTRNKTKSESRNEPNFINQTEESDRESFYEPESSYREEMEPSKVSISTPPKNALLLTRSRSAPYRSSSLACRFWGSPISNSVETEQKQEEEKSDESSPSSKKDSISDLEPVILERESEVKLGLFEGSILKSLQIEGDEDAVNNTLRPLILTRCKSEPARTAEKKLDPELSSWRKRRLGFT